jgi:ADP-ribose pyrophosphatase YjhB (NUDIX family)
MVVGAPQALTAKGDAMKQAGVMLIVKDGLIVSISRRHDKTIFGLPGGKFSPDPPDNDKDTMDTAIRETREETSVVVKKCVLVYERVEKGDGPTGVDYYSRCYYATDWEGTPIDSEEGVVKWLTPDELTSTKAAFGDYNKKTLQVFKSMFPGVMLFPMEDEVRQNFAHLEDKNLLEVMVQQHYRYGQEYREKVLLEWELKKLPTYQSNRVKHHPWANRCKRCGRWNVAEGEMEMYGPYWYCPVCDKHR